MKKKKTGLTAWGDTLVFQKLIYKKSIHNYYRLYGRSRKNCKDCVDFPLCATDLGTVESMPVLITRHSIGIARK